MAVEAPAVELGWRAAAFTLRGTDGSMHSFESLRGDKATLVAFICNHCPYVKAVLPRLIRDARELRAFGVAVIAINPNDDAAYPEDGFDRMVALARELQFPFAYLRDETQRIARAYGAVCTPDFMGFDSDRGLRYRGRLDASRKELAGDDAPRELFDAMRRIARTGSGPAIQNQSIGCSIKWRD